MDINSGILSIIMPMQDLQAVLQATGSISALAGEVERLSSACECGKLLFVDFMAEVRSITFAKSVQDCILRLETTDYSEAEIQNTKDELYAKAIVVAKANPSSDYARREVKIEYLQADLPMSVADVHQEWSMWLYAHLKQKLVAEDMTFPRLPWEDWILSPHPDTTIVKVEPCGNLPKSIGACTTSAGAS